ncbi:hypothetical protein [Kutzneria sp. 744]|uniref:hypothetical protein n=1 Tax=Kutzneria sp. (strain 744) TaxID=345341 RepID=UPI0012FB1421|nr:hypothetical protein [Kutzneria sp. 744]
MKKLWNPTTASWDTVDVVERDEMLSFDQIGISAEDVGGEPGEQLLAELVMIDEEDTERVVEMGVVEAE